MVNEMNNVLLILKKEPNETLKTMITGLEKQCRIKIHDLRKDKKYDQLVDEIFENDKVITW